MNNKDLKDLDQSLASFKETVNALTKVQAMSAALAKSTSELNAHEAELYKAMDQLDQKFAKFEELLNEYGDDTDNYIAEIKDLSADQKKQAWYNRTW